MRSLNSVMPLRSLGSMRGYKPMVEAKSPSPPPSIKFGEPTTEFRKKYVLP